MRGLVTAIIFKLYAIDCNAHCSTRQSHAKKGFCIE